MTCWMFRKLSVGFFCMALTLPLAGIARSVESRQVTSDKVPWTFWAVLEKYGGIGYSYTTNKALTRSMGFWHYYKPKTGFNVSEGYDSTYIGDNEALMGFFKNLSAAELVGLSPIEKLALVSNYNFQELEMLIKDDAIFFAEDWWGIAMVWLMHL